VEVVGLARFDRGTVVHRFAETIDDTAEQSRTHLDAGLLAARRQGIAQLQAVNFFQRHGEHVAVAETDDPGANRPAAGRAHFAKIADGDAGTARFHQQADHLGHLAGPAYRRQAVELGDVGGEGDLHDCLFKRSAKPRSISCSCESTEASRLPCRVSKITVPNARDGSAITSTWAEAVFWRRLSVTSATWAGWTRTREISCPCNFSRAPSTRPWRASGSMASSRLRTRRAIARESWIRSLSASARRRARRPPISSMHRARRSITGCTSAAARWRPAASPSRIPASWASRARSSHCCFNCARRTRESGTTSESTPRPVGPEACIWRQTSGSMPDVSSGCCTLDDIGATIPPRLQGARCLYLRR